MTWNYWLSLPLPQSWGFSCVQDQVYITQGIEPRASSWQSIHQLSYIPALFHLLVAQAGYCSLVYCIVAKDDLWLLALLPLHPESRDSRFVHQAQTSSQDSPQAFTKKKKKKLFLKLVFIELNFSIGKYCFSFIMGRLTRRYMLGAFHLHPKNKRLFPLIYCHLFLSIKLQHSNLNSQIEMHYPNWQVWGELIHYVRCPVNFRLHLVSLETSWLLSCIFRVDGSLGSHAVL